MAEYVITDENFDELINGDKPVLVDFFATWCGPCQMMSPLVSELSEEHPEIIVGKLNVDDYGDLARKYRVASIPTLILFKKGEIAAKNVGAVSKAELEKFIAQ